MSFVKLATSPSAGAVLQVAEAEGATLNLCADGSGRVTGLPELLWEFEVSGYPVLRRWMEGRKGQAVDLALFDAYRDISGRIADLIDLFDQADAILAEALDTPLIRNVLWPEAAEDEADSSR